MLDIDTLDNVIAVVVVILLLSLIVQSVQAVIKKALKIKSKQLEDSLLDLFDAVLRGRTEPRAKNYMPTAFSPSAAKVAGEPAKKLLQSVREQMRALGRVSSTGNFMIDSLSKSDLLSVIARIGPNDLVPGFVDKLKTALVKINAIDTAVKSVNASVLPGEANALFAKLQAALAPLRQQYKTFMDGGGVDRKLIVADIIALRDVVFDDSLELLANAQKVVGQQNVPAAATALASVTAAITEAREALDDAFGAFKAKLGEIEQWFDTTMQSFEERYHRGMRTWSLIIAAAVVVYLNANPFSIYRSVATNEVLRATLVNGGPEIQQLADKLADAEKKDETEQKPATLEDVKKKRAELEQVVGIYTSYGFEPLTLRSVGAWFDGLIYRNVGAGSWWSRRGNDVRTLFGWLIMTMLLSLGAPFWHDTLESLFGVKNLLRKRTDTQNVEQRRGAGNPKP
ncbi:MAG TPA: hypothetical protein VF432_26665 [Thermoanaerobaculia bacterium]